MFTVIFLIIGFIIATWLAVWLATSQLEKSIYETFKKLGIKALSIIGLIGLFTSGSEQLSENSNSSNEQKSD